MTTLSTGGTVRLTAARDLADHQVMGQSVRSYGDINENLRHWFDRVFDSIASPVFYDIGANDGVFSIGYARRCREVHAFEPSRAAAERLTERSRETRLANIRLHRLALSDTPGTLVLYRYSDDTFNTLYRRTDFELSHYSLGEAESEEVEVARLDDVVDRLQLPPPDVLKMDIEGAELFALRGGEATIRSAMPVVLVEYSVDNTSNAGYDRSEIADLLSGWGYRVYGLHRNTDVTLHSGAKLAERSIWNLLCLPSHKANLAR